MLLKCGNKFLLLSALYFGVPVGSAVSMHDGKRPTAWFACEVPMLKKGVIGFERQTVNELCPLKSELAQYPQDETSIIENHTVNMRQVRMCESPSKFCVRKFHDIHNGETRSGATSTWSTAEQDDKPRAISKRTMTFSI